MICNLKLGRQPTAEMVNFAKATMKMHSPLPTGDMRQEFVKATEIINSFVKPENVGPDMAIPPNILANAKGVAVLTVVKAGFVFSGRAGAGVVIARLPSGQWSAPSAIGTAGMGWVHILNKGSPNRR